MIPDHIVEAALDAQRRACGYGNPIGSFREGWPDAYAEDMAAQRAALEAAAPMLAPQWIPCGERMPKKGERVLVWMACRKRASLTIATWTGEVWFHHVGDYHESDVSHWMPLPQPPKEGAPSASSCPWSPSPSAPTGHYQVTKR